MDKYLNKETLLQFTIYFIIFVIIEYLLDVFIFQEEFQLSWFFNIGGPILMVILKPDKKVKEEKK